MSINKEALKAEVEKQAGLEENEKENYTVCLTVEFGRAVLVDEITEVVWDLDLDFSDEFIIEDNQIVIRYDHVNLDNVFKLAERMEERNLDAKIEIFSAQPYRGGRKDISVTAYQPK